MVWWGWIFLGLALLAIELATPGGLVALFFGLSALIVGVLAALGVASPAMQWVLFSVIALANLVLLRRPLRARLSRASSRTVDALVGESVVVSEEFGPGGVGKVEMRGSSWNARTAGGSSLARGVRCRVERVDGLTLWVRPEQKETGT